MPRKLPITGQLVHHRRRGDVIKAKHKSRQQTPHSFKPYYNTCTEIEQNASSEDVKGNTSSVRVTRIATFQIQWWEKVPGASRR